MAVNNALSGLLPGTPYHYQAAANSAGTGTGSDGTFTTLPDVPAAMPDISGVYTERRHSECHGLILRGPLQPGISIRRNNQLRQPQSDQYSVSGHEPCGADVVISGFAIGYALP